MEQIKYNFIFTKKIYLIISLLFVLLLMIFLIHMHYSTLTCGKRTSISTTKTGEKNDYIENFDSLKDLTNSKINYAKTKYDSNNYNVVYHDLEADMNAQAGIYKSQQNFYNVLNQDGSMVSIPYYGNDNPTLPIYNEPGSFIYGSSNYIPTYEDSIYLSKSTGISSTRELTPEYNYIGGFCQQYKYSEIQLEQKCNSIPRDQCASTSCCVLLGGSKCVSGNDKGPYKKANYSDKTIRNKDYYYYKGKCYGRCDKSIKEELSDDEEDKHHHHKHYDSDDEIKSKSRIVDWKTYFTTNEHNLLENNDQTNDETNTSNLNIPNLYRGLDVSKNKIYWEKTTKRISPSNAYDEQILSNKNDILPFSKNTMK